MTQSTPLGFLDLPPEIRNLVYRLTFLSTTTTLTKYKPIDEPIECAQQLYYGYAPLLCTNKTIRNEALALFFFSTKFIFLKLDILMRWYSQLASNLRPAVKCVRWLVYVEANGSKWIGASKLARDSMKEVNKAIAEQYRTGLVFEERLTGAELRAQLVSGTKGASL